MGRRGVAGGDDPRARRVFLNGVVGAGLKRGRNTKTRNEETTKVGVEGAIGWGWSEEGLDAESALTPSPFRERVRGDVLGAQPRAAVLHGGRERGLEVGVVGWRVTSE